MPVNPSPRFHTHVRIYFLHPRACVLLCFCPSVEKSFAYVVNLSHSRVRLPTSLAALLSLIWIPDLVQGGTLITLVLTVQLFFFFFLFFANTKWWHHESTLFTSSFSTNGFSIYWWSFWWANPLNMAKWWLSVPFINGLSPLKKSFLLSTGEAPLSLVKCQDRCLFLSPESQLSREGGEMWPDPSRVCLSTSFSLASENCRGSRSHVCSVNHSQVCLYKVVSGGSAGWFPLTFGQVMLVVLTIKDYLRLTLVTSSWISCFLRTWSCSFFSFSAEFLETKSFQDHSLDRVRENIFKFSWHDINSVYSNFTWQVSCLD